MARRSPMNDRYTTERSGGATRGKAGSMKPATSAAASVRVRSSKKPTGTGARGKAMAMMNADAGKTKEEKKAERAQRRQEEDTLYTAGSILCNKDAKYQMWRRVWWGCLIGAVVFTALSWASLSTGVGGQVVSVVVLVLAYATIIAALVIDLGPVRRRRNVYRDKVGSMTKKQVERIVTESYVDRQATDAAKKARRAAKKAGQDPEAAYKAAYDAYVAQSAHAGRRDEGTAGSGAGTTKVTEVAEGAATSGAGKGGRGILFGKRAKDRAQGTPVDEAVQAAEPEAPAQAAQAEAEVDEAERARREAAAKAAREFAASRRSGTGK